MNNKFLFLAAFAAAALVGCNKDANNDNALKGEAASVTVRIGNIGTKAVISGAASSSSQLSDEVAVERLQVVVFNGEQVDGYATTSMTADPNWDGESLAVDCTAGARTIYAVVNGQGDYKAVTSKADFLSKVSDLAENSLDCFLMLGDKAETLPVTGDVTIDVHRLVARIVLRGIKNDMLAEGARTYPMIVKEIYAKNAAGDSNLGETEQPTKWYNEKILSASDVPSLLSETGIEHTIAYGDTYDDCHVFYVYPHNGSRSYGTILQVNTTLNGIVSDYPIPISYEVAGQMSSVIEANKSYEIDLFTIQHQGNPTDDEDNGGSDPIEAFNQSFKINVVDWDVVPITNHVNQ